MSAFNTVTAKCLCPICGETREFFVQFKYGDTWQHQYRIGDILKWGGNDVGVQGVRRVRVEGIGGPCPHCKADNLEADVFLNDDRIERVMILGNDRPNPLSDGIEIVE
jgi:hypothetical protein